MAVDCYVGIEYDFKNPVISACIWQELFIVNFKYVGNHSIFYLEFNGIYCNCNIGACPLGKCAVRVLRSLRINIVLVKYVFFMAHTLEAY